MTPSAFMLKPHLIIEITNPLLVLLDGLNKQAFKTTNNVKCQFEDIMMMMSKCLCIAASYSL